MKFYINLSLLLIPFLMLSCMKDNTTDLALQEEQLLVEYLQNNNITAAPTPSGLYYIESVHGIGNAPQSGDSVLVHYTGYTIYGEKFDSSYDRNEAFGFRLGTGRVIAGWDEGIGYMQKGAEATLIIPSSLAYGASGVPGIPPYSTLLFEVKLISIID
ncbi:MAG: FKBP-type peptidyl-prolyl cis-trans isomerase [Bacteroidales bacterium]|nr:FKBP-type peptidyl-prolyl cis-trans isomerase [Bacteroidales bacterium]MCF8458501.1 FKBP-type peptidyl-prolyl cis-trans isomerase [Bacteroidales bacterium]